MRWTAPLIIMIGMTIAGCQSSTGTGALAGSGIGVIGGGLISHSAGGAMIGGAVGAAGGALIGAALDDSDRTSLNKQSPNTLRKIDRGEQLSIDDVKRMSRAGISDDVIISQIDATKSIFYLSTADIVDLKKAGISQRVIHHMIQTGNK